MSLNDKFLYSRRLGVLGKILFNYYDFCNTGKDIVFCISGSCMNAVKMDDTVRCKSELYGNIPKFPQTIID